MAQIVVIEVKVKVCVCVYICVNLDRYAEHSDLSSHQTTTDSSPGSICTLDAKQAYETFAVLIVSVISGKASNTSAVRYSRDHPGNIAQNPTVGNGENLSRLVLHHIVLVAS